MVICEYLSCGRCCFADVSANARLQGLQEEVLDDSDTNCELYCYVYGDNR